MNISVTGASGHIGANLIRILIERKHKVTVLYNIDDRAFKELDVNIVQGSLYNTYALEKLVLNADVVFHLAANISILGDKDGSVCRTNVEGTKNIVNASIKAGVKKFIHFSSIHAFNQNPLNEPLDENRSLVGNNASSYDKSKAEGERIVLNSIEKGLDAIILSPTSIIGPFDFKPSLMGQVLIKMYNNQIHALVSGGYDWVDVRDVALSAYNSITMGVKGEKYLLSGKWASLKELSLAISKCTNKKTPKFVCPSWLAKAWLPILNLYDKAKGNAPLYTSESLEILALGNRSICNNKAKNVLKHNPRSLEETLIDTYKWFIENKYLN